MHCPTVVCVNDGSTDGSAARDPQRRRLPRRPPDQHGPGRRAADRHRVRPDAARHRRFVTFDADGQHRVEDALPDARDPRRTDVDIVLGSRFLGEVNGASLLRRTVLRMAVQFTNATSGVKLTDAHNGLRAFNRHVADTMRITVLRHDPRQRDHRAHLRNGYKYVEVARDHRLHRVLHDQGPVGAQRRQHRLRHPAPQGEQPMILVQVLLIVAAVAHGRDRAAQPGEPRRQRVEEAAFPR